MAALKGYDYVKDGIIVYAIYWGSCYGAIDGYYVDAWVICLGGG